MKKYKTLIIKNIFDIPEDLCVLKIIEITL